MKGLFNPLQIWTLRRLGLGPSTKTRVIKLFISLFKNLYTVNWYIQIIDEKSIVFIAITFYIHYKVVSTISVLKGYQHAYYYLCI